MAHIFAIIVISLLIGILIFSFGYILSLSIELYFMKFEMEKHPILITMINDVLAKLCKEENLTVFHIPYKELNKEKTNKEEYALGMYIYTLNDEHQHKCDFLISEIEEMERDWGKSIGEICKILKTDTIIKEDYILPKILLCAEEKEFFGILSYYSTFFHEIGHHFAIKYNQDRTEEGANRFAHKLVNENLPYFFNLFPFINFKYRLNLNDLNFMEAIKAYWQYLLYLLTTNKKYINLVTYLRSLRITKKTKNK